MYSSPESLPVSSNLSLSLFKASSEPSASSSATSEDTSASGSCDSLSTASSAIFPAIRLAVFSAVMNSEAVSFPSSSSFLYNSSRFSFAFFAPSGSTDDEPPDDDPPDDDPPDDEPPDDDPPDDDPPDDDPPEAIVLNAAASFDTSAPESCKSFESASLRILSASSAEEKSSDLYSPPESLPASSSLSQSLSKASSEPIALRSAMSEDTSAPGFCDSLSIAPSDTLSAICPTESRADVRPEAESFPSSFIFARSSLRPSLSPSPLRRATAPDISASGSLSSFESASSSD